MPIRFLVIDGFNLIRRIYEARIHKEKHLGESSNVSGEDMKQVIEATKSSLARALKVHQPTQASRVWCCICGARGPEFWCREL